jgi:tetratricopeptide (TPR) repeat protein
VNNGAWLDALLDGDVTPNSDEVGADANPVLRKLIGLQRAFAELHFAELDAPEDESSVLFKWGQLSVLEQIHVGHDVTLFRAFDPMLQREVALKLRGGGQSPTSIESDRPFIVAARRLATVRHPNVLAIQGAALHQGRAGLWMDLVQGETLAAHVARDGALSADTLLRLTTQLAAALCAVHAKAIVHGALVPTKVMIEAAQGGRFLLMDFAENGSTESGSTENVGEPRNTGAQTAQTSASDIQALGGLLYFAATAAPYLGHDLALARRRDLSKGLRALLSSILSASAKPLSAQQVLAQCHLLRDAPILEQRARLRRALSYVLVGALLADSVALFFTLRTRAAAEVQRNRVVAVRDFLLDVLRAPDPTQTIDPAHGLAQLFEQAIAALPKAFAADPYSEAQLLHQFGRSMIVFDQDTQALDALLRADQRFAQAGVLPSALERIETRSYLSDVYRSRREFPAAIALTTEQAQWCKFAAPASTQSGPIAARGCVAIINDQIEAVGYGGDPERALTLVTKNLALAKSAGLELEYESVFTTYLAGVLLRDLGRFADSRAAFVELSERTLVAVPAGHPGLLTDLMWLAWGAHDLADFEIAQRLNAHALKGRLLLYPSTSRYVVEVRIQQATLALHAGDKNRARALARALVNELPKTPAMRGFLENATILAALAGDPEVSEAALLNAEETRTLALGEAAPKLAELRLNLAAIALQRGQYARAQTLVSTVADSVTQSSTAYLVPLLTQLQGTLAARHAPHREALAASEFRHAVQLLQTQNRCLFDPISGTWIGALGDDPPARLAQATRQVSLARISVTGEKILNRRALLDRSKSP